MKVIPGEGPPPEKSAQAPSGPGASEVVGIDARGRLLVHQDGEVARYKLFVGGDGTMRAVRFTEPKNDNDIDQIGERESVPVAARWANCDQT